MNQHLCNVFEKSFFSYLETKNLFKRSANVAISEGSRNNPIGGPISLTRGPILKRKFWGQKNDFLY